MYLNANLTPPSSGADGLKSTTPKTPEILNSLMNLTFPPLPDSANNLIPLSLSDSYTNNPTNRRQVRSPSSCSTTPSEEISTFPLGSTTPCNSQLSPCSSDQGTYGSSTFRASTLAAGTPSPPVPRPSSSPLRSVQATKSALIKEGLRHQIKSKLEAAGMAQQEIIGDSNVSEGSWDSEELTPQDEQRRLRRRERNKIAATKCRNKKKERTIILMSESETVEDQNIRLKTEIQRLTTEKIQLEKLLEDPSHVASCRHFCNNGVRQLSPILIPNDHKPPGIAVSLPIYGVSSNVIHQSLGATTNVPSSSAAISSTDDISCSANESSTSTTSVYGNVSSSSASFSTISPKISSSSTLGKVEEIPNTNCSSSYNSSITMLELCSTTASTRNIYTNQSQLQNAELYALYDNTIDPFSSTGHLTEKSTHHHSATRRHQPYSTSKYSHQPYSTSKYSHHRSINYPNESLAEISKDFIHTNLLGENAAIEKLLPYNNYNESETSFNEGDSKLHCNIGKIQYASTDSQYNNSFVKFDKYFQSLQPIPSSESLQEVKPAETLTQTNSDLQFSSQYVPTFSVPEYFVPCTFGGP